jgi:dihydroorotate dehydrogenase
VPIIGVGGVMCAEHAYEKIRAGASLVQVYTGFIYGGPGFAAQTCAGLAALLARDGFASVADAVGADLPGR